MGRSEEDGDGVRAFSADPEGPYSGGLTPCYGPSQGLCQTCVCGEGGGRNVPKKEHERVRRGGK